MKRLASTGLLVVPIGLLAIVCGGKGGSAAHAAARPPATKAYARAVNIQAADVPRLTAQGREAQAFRSERIVAAFRCGGGIVGRDTTSIRPGSSNTTR